MILNNATYIHTPCVGLQYFHHVSRIAFLRSKRRGPDDTINSIVTLFLLLWFSYLIV